MVSLFSTYPSHTHTHKRLTPHPPQQLSLKSHWKLNQQSEIPTFLAAAAALVPTMQRDFEQLATRVESQLECCNPEGRAVLLASHRYLSNIDLQFVNGQHHQGSRGLESVDLLEEGTCAVGFG